MAKEDDAFIKDIADDVVGVLTERGFFATLDAMFVSAGGACNNDFSQTRAILRSLKFAEDDIADVLGVLHSRGACCDCEVLYNVAPESKLREQYWKAKARDETEC